MPLPDEREGLSALDVVVPALLEIDARIAVRVTGIALGVLVLRLVQAQVDALNRLADLVEAEQVDLDVVVDVQPGQLAQRLRYQQDARTLLREQVFGTLRAGVIEAVEVRRVEFEHAVSGDAHPGVAREGDDRRRFPSAGICKIIIVSVAES